MDNCCRTLHWTKVASSKAKKENKRPRNNFCLYIENLQLTAHEKRARQFERKCLDHHRRELLPNWNDCGRVPIRTKGRDSRQTTHEPTLLFCQSNPLPFGELIDPPSSLLPRLVHSNLEMSDEPLYEVSHIVEEDYSNPNQRVFLVRWLGYTPAADSWEPLENLEDGAIEVVREWDRKKKQAQKRKASETKASANNVKGTASQIRDGPRKPSSGRVKSSQKVRIV